MKKFELSEIILSAISVIALIVTLLVVSLTGYDSAAKTDSEKNRGEITVYTSLEDELTEEYFQSFNERYPEIKVNVVQE